MDNLIDKIKSINLLYTNLDKEIANFRSTTNIHCIQGCGKCCLKDTLEASPLEFIPWAFHLFMNHQAETVLETLKNNPQNICVIYKTLDEFDATKGYCSEYQHRGLICRLFGYAATKDKYGKLRMATCKNIKETQNSEYLYAESQINSNLKIPIFTDYYTQLSNIDYHLGSLYLPINKAIQMAIEEVLQYYAYRPFPSEI